MAKSSTNPQLHFRAIPGGTHFSIIRPLVEEIGSNILADDPQRAEFIYQKGE
jgi:hypothetical protein